MTADAEQEVNLVLTIADCNVLLSLLNEVPMAYRITAPLIAKIHQQISKKLPDAFREQEDYTCD